MRINKRRFSENIVGCWLLVVGCSTNTNNYKYFAISYKQNDDLSTIMEAIGFKMLL